MSLTTKIVLTGGPRAGKSSIIKYLKHELPKFGFTAVVVPEMATSVFMAGVKPENVMATHLSTYMFQMRMIKSQISLEEIYHNFAVADLIGQKAKNQKMVLIMDRGTLDNLAYVQEPIRSNVLKGVRQNYESLAEAYDGVIYLETSAVSQDYDHRDNEIRHEVTNNAALLADTLVKEVWELGTKAAMVPMKYISYVDDFEQKKKNVLVATLDILDDYERGIRV